MVKGEAIVDLSPLLPYGDVRALLEAGMLAQAEELAAVREGDLAVDDVEVLLPVDRPRKIICIGINYAERHEEYNDPSAPSPRPNMFLRTVESFVAHGQPIVRPKVSDQLDYEGEIALVIGRHGRYIEEADALSHVAGLTVANEGTLRDWLKHSKKNITQGKNFDASGSMGPWIETDRSLLTAELRVQTWVSGEQRQNDTTARMVYPFAHLIHYVSQFSALHPGDVILTGTPTGAGIRMDPPRFLTPGDTLTIEVSGVGRLENPIVDEPR
ncbi:fumarylacetoacetate hydrolase family protein [Sphingomonas sp.]|uniref:fumarylacetoacetate hydrolase family protein n=1 Tax=Sphingomonas sp. TaxID=28214 RepID=UPI00345B53F7